MILHVLGGGPAQVNLIKRIREKGYGVAVSDMNPDAPGMALADYPTVVSSFDHQGVIREARRIGSDRFLTLGTDQPVLTAALASEALGLPYFLTADQARIVTNKKAMKRMFAEHRIPSMPFRILCEDFRVRELEGLRFPLVIKPLDSQGQRGVQLVRSAGEIRNKAKEVLGFSRESEFLAEEYYPSREVTVSGWVKDGTLHIFSITDRETVENYPYMGVCVSHRYPSRFHSQFSELEDLSRRICRSVGLQDGAVYFQILGGNEGFRVNEIACRLGGAYEDEFLPVLCAADPLDLLIEQTAGPFYTWMYPEAMAGRREGRYFSLQMFFCKPGRIDRQEGMEQVRDLPGIGGGRFLLKEGTEIVNRENSTQRAGYFFLFGSSPEDVNRRIDEAYGYLAIKDAQGKQMIERSDRMYFPV